MSRCSCAMHFLVAICALSAVTPGRADNAPPTPAPLPNLVQNGNFEQAKDNLPQNWTFTSANPEIFTTKIEPTPESGNVLHLEATDAKMSGYWIQTIDVKPQTDYVFEARVRVASGKVLVWVINAKGEKKIDNRAYIETLKNHPLVPLFWKPEWVMGNTNSHPNGLGPVRNYLTEANKWIQIAIPFNSGEFNSIRVNLGSYFEVGNYWFDDVVVREATPMEISAQKKAGEANE